MPERKISSKDGRTMQGTLDMRQFKIINVNPTLFLEMRLFRKVGLKIIFYNYTEIFH